MKDKTRQLLDDAAKARRKQHPRRITLTHLAETKAGKKLQRQYTKARKALAARTREIRQTEGHFLARVWTRAGG